MTPILLNWQASNTFGWGLVGLYTFSHWALSDELKPIMGFPIRPQDVMLMDPLRMSRIEPHIHESNRASAQFATRSPLPGQSLKIDIPVIHSVGNLFAVRNMIEGTKNIGRIVFEDSRTADRARDEAAKFDFIVAMCEWNANLLRQSCNRDVVLIPEGTDTSLFHPGPRSGLMDPCRFYIFSGGKIEFRKGQDLVLRAFRAFAQRHDDAVLVTSWHSPWPKLAEGFKGTLDHPIGLDSQGQIDIKKWAADNGIDPARVIDICAVPNPIMPTILREMDCAIFPNRCEAATNLVAMEAMACGVPAVIANNTGLADLIEDSNCLPLNRQAAVANPDGRGTEGWGTEGWGESDTEELIEAMERLYTSPDLRKNLAAGGVAAMQTRTWKHHADRLKRAVLERL